MISTASALVSLIAMLVCLGAVKLCVEEARALRVLRLRVGELDADLQMFEKQFRKLAGRYYATSKTEPQQQVEPAVDVLGPVCEYYLAAQKEGPGSLAAQHDCLYCNGKRAERARARALLVPKTAKGQGDLARTNSGRS